MTTTTVSPVSFDGLCIDKDKGIAGDGNATDSSTSKDSSNGLADDGGVEEEASDDSVEEGFVLL